MGLELHRNEKPLYSKFQYRLKVESERGGGDPNIATQWTSIRTSGSATEAEAFVNDKLRGLERGAKDGGDIQSCGL